MVNLPQPTLPANPAPVFRVRDIPVYGDAILAPMDGYSDLPFRSLCRSLGSAMSYTEFVNVKDILAGRALAEKKLRYLENERPLVFQLNGDDSQEIFEAALRVRELNPDIIDINMGCPAKTISNRGAGVGLMRTPEKIARIFSLLTQNLDVPITGKMRLGWADDQRNYLEVARIVQDNGGALLAVHGRTKKQGYSGQADWTAIGEVVNALSIPVIGNGDVQSVADIEKMKAQTGCTAVMIGRAAMSNPWIFSRLERAEVPVQQVEETLLRHLQLNQGFYGPERGLVLVRKFASRYLAPFGLAPELRKRLLTAEQPTEFIALLAEIVASAPIAQNPLPLPELAGCGLPDPALLLEIE